VRQAIASRVFENAGASLEFVEEDDTAIGSFSAFRGRRRWVVPTRAVPAATFLLTGARVDFGRIFYGCWRSFGDLDFEADR